MQAFTRAAAALVDQPDYNADIQAWRDVLYDRYTSLRLAGFRRALYAKDRIRR